MLRIITKSDYIFISRLKIVLSSNDIYLYTSDNNKKQFLPVDKAHNNIVPTRIDNNWQNINKYLSDSNSDTKNSYNLKK